VSPRHDRGSVTLELAVLAPVLLILLGLVVVAARFEAAAGAVEHAAAAGARSASLQRTATAAQHAATEAARANLDGEGVVCEGLDVRVETGGYATAAGTAGSVVVTVACSVPFQDQGIPGLPGSRRVQAQVTSPRDVYRGR
jgi:Flp pilus assembly protein TadG